MAKKIVNNEQEIVVEPLQRVNPEINMTEHAYSVTQTGPAVYALVLIKFSLEHNLVDQIRVIRDGMTKDEAQIAFKIEVANNIFLR
jgi:hypothetical protein